MLSPGDQVFIDNDHNPSHRWTVASVTRRGDLNGGPATNYYTLVDWPDPNEEITPDRITAHWVET